jgi:hypothetical protein
MQIGTRYLALFLAGCVLRLQAYDSLTGWIPDRAHPQVEYRLQCTRGALTIQWQNSYPGAVTLKFRVRGSNYDGEEDVTIPPGGSASSDPDTLYCIASAFEITEKRFSMAAPPTPVTPKAAAADAKPPAPPPPTVAPWIPPAKIPELAPATFALIHAGMKREEVVRAIGDPMSKLSIPEANDLIETYRYPVSPGRAGTVRFSNGVVKEVVVR